MKLIAALAALAALIALALAPTALAVDEGVADRARHPFVGLLGFDVDGSGPAAAALLCSGSVLSDRHFLTAAHCIPAVPPGVEWVVTLEPGTPRASVVLPGVFPDDFPFPFTTAAKRGGVAFVHPHFDPERRAHDLAVIRFPRGTFDGVEPVALPAAGQLDRLPLARRTIRLVGYGADPEFGDGAPVFVVEGYRQTATAPFQALTQRQLVFDGSTRQGGLCLGDSGSPQLLGDSRLALSLFSAHTEDCRGLLWSQRLDTRSERRFLARFAELP
jgi:Trypsin